MKQIYISKSKVGNPDDLMYLRSLLSQWDCEVTEFFGGKYTTEVLDKADLLIVLPPYLHNNDPRRTDVGAGQHSETNRFMIQHDTFYSAFVVQHITQYEVVFERIRTSEAFAPSVSNYQDHFGYISVCDDVPWEMCDVMDQHKIKWIGTTSKVAHSLLLIASEL